MPKIDVTKTELVWPGKYEEDGTLKGVGVGSTATSSPPPIVIEPVQERLEYDIAIPITKPSLKHDHRKEPLIYSSLQEDNGSQKRRQGVE